MTTKRSFKKADLDKYVEENEIELIGEYEKVNRDTKIKGKCKTEGCEEIFEKGFRKLIEKTAYYCNDCNPNGKKKSLKKIIQNMEKIHGNTYDYSLIKPEDYKSTTSKLPIKCNIDDHGIFYQSYELHHNRGYGCPKCGQIRANIKRMYSQEEIIQQFKNIYGELFDYSQFEYKGDKIPGIIICHQHGPFSQTPELHKRSYINTTNLGGCPECRYIEVAAKLRLPFDVVIQNMEKKHDNTYDYSLIKPEDYKDQYCLLPIKCNIDGHGVFHQSYSNHYKGQGCPECGRIKSGINQRTSFEDVIQNMKNKHDNTYDYSLIKPEDYTGSHSRLPIICNINGHGVFYQDYSNHAKGIGCPKCGIAKRLETTLKNHGCKSCGLFCVFNKRRKNNDKEDDLCEYCQPMKTNKLREKTKEMLVVRKLGEDLPDIPFIHNKSVGSECTLQDRENTNGHLYPDIRFDLPTYQLIVEVDEYRHRGASYSCDERRMYEITKQLGLPCVFIRYNPDDKKSDYNVLLEMIKEYLEKDMNEIDFDEHSGLKVAYLNY
tara:strand:- start:925 stop:2556 length:1632 start_codon:yes stop_codon:yes gene_type:complete